MTIYLDVVFIENLLMNAIILYATGIVTKTKNKIIKIIISSGVGSAYAIRDIHNRKLYILQPHIKNTTLNHNDIHSIQTSEHKITIQAPNNILPNIIRIWWLSILPTILHKTKANPVQKRIINRNIPNKNSIFRCNSRTSAQYA